MPDKTQRIGKFDVRIEFCEPQPDTQARSERRVETLTAWLLAQWQAERKEPEHAGTGAAA
ncbi:MAG: hypothetical protein KDA55_07265 [Planctomycetales bacterium]|nr:hypothetical protein [Planctomycetales bacterium]